MNPETVFLLLFGALMTLLGGVAAFDAKGTTLKVARLVTGIGVVSMLPFFARLWIGVIFGA